jgi:hypothetical protein
MARCRLLAGHEEKSVIDIDIDIARRAPAQACAGGAA